MIFNHTSKQQHNLINRFVGWMYPTVPCSLNALYVFCNNWQYNSHPYQSNNGKKDRESKGILIFMVKGPFCDRSKAYIYVGGWQHPNLTHLKLIKSRACRWLNCLGLLFISMPVNYLGHVWFCSLLRSSYEPSRNYLWVTIHRLTWEDTVNAAPWGLKSFSGTTV